MKINELKKIWSEIVDHNMIEDLGSRYHEIQDNVQNGCYLIYYDHVRSFLKDLYNETEEEAEKYTDQQVWDRYKHLIAFAGDINTIKRHRRAFNEWAFECEDVDPVLYRRLLLLTEDGSLNEWILECSTDCNNLDFSTLIRSVYEPGFWLCYEIAEANGCEFFTISEA